MLLTNPIDYLAKTWPVVFIDKYDNDNFLPVLHVAGSYEDARRAGEKAARRRGWHVYESFLAAGGERIYVYVDTSGYDRTPVAKSQKLSIGLLRNPGKARARARAHFGQTVSSPASGASNRYPDRIVYAPVVNARAYHGSPHAFSMEGAQISSGGDAVYGPGIYLATSPQIALEYARKHGGSGHLQVCIVNLHNPINYGVLKEEQYGNQRARQISGLISEQMIQPSYGRWAIEEMLKMGHDGIVVHFRRYQDFRGLAQIDVVRTPGEATDSYYIVFSPQSLRCEAKVPEAAPPARPAARQESRPASSKDFLSDIMSGFGSSLSRKSFR